MSFSKLQKAAVVIWWLLVLAPNTCWSESQRLLVVLSDRLPAYQSFANTLKQSLPESVQAIVLENPGEIADQPLADLIVSVGMKASLFAVGQTKMPVLVVMVPRASYEALLEKTSRKDRAPSISAIYLDQPWERQLNFIQDILPKHVRIGMLYSDNTQIDMTLLQKQVSKRDIKLVAKRVLSEDGLFSALDELLASSDILLAVPDNMIYNSKNIRNILLSCYRSGIPFVGLSQAYVNAGAIGAVSTFQLQLADQIAESIRLFAHTGKLPKPSYSSEFTISLNPEVARSMGIKLPAADTVKSHMYDLSRGDQ
jgi:putative ABC transport system substrate-binding protein